MKTKTDDGSEYRKLLRNIYFFHALPEQSLEKIAALCVEVSFHSGDILFFEDTSGDTFYIIIEGELEIWKRYGTPDAVLLGISNAGQPLGEMALIDDHPRSATVRARTAVRAYSIRAADFQTLLSTDNALCTALLKAVTMMVRRSNDYHLLDMDRQHRELERAYAELKVMQDELLNRERLSVIGKFSSLILHDIRNPLSALKSRVALLLDNYKDRNYCIQAIEGINRDISRMELLAAEFLDYSRGEIRLDMDVVSLDELFQLFSDAMSKRLADSGVTLTINSCIEKPHIMDKQRMLRVLINAAENACKAMDGGGNLYMDAVEKDGQVVLTVRDTGVGMTQDMIENIFTPFYSASSGGTGLGMIIIKSIVEAHGGTVGVESRVGEGTTVRITLPAHA